jgi:predicted AlkP superfamily pyrophosphatase or phosphodiesterase
MSRLRGIVFLLAVVLAVSGTCPTRAWRGPDVSLTRTVLGSVSSASSVGHQTGTGPTPILVLVSFDGWRWDYVDRYPTPNLRALAKQGARAERLIPSFPVLTFPNHYTIVTGLYPEHHGIVSNNMRDPTMPERFAMAADTARDAAWWKGEPIWVTAIRQGRRAATMFWPGSEAPIDGVRPTFWKPYDKKVTSTARVDQVLAWLALPEAERPAFVSVYFDEVDSASHDVGIGSPEFLAATEHLDGALGRLVDGIGRLSLQNRTTIVVVSDHGMAPLSRDRVVYLDDYVALDSIEIFESVGLLQIAPKDGNVDALYARLHDRHPALAVYKRDQIPPRLHYAGSDRIAPIIGIPKAGWAITTHVRLADRPLQGATHGFDPRDRSMGAMFVAAGPDIARGIVVPPFENVDIYNFLCRVLRLTPAKNDGSPALARRLHAD